MTNSDNLRVVEQQAKAKQPTAKLIAQVQKALLVKRSTLTPALNTFTTASSEQCPILPCQNIPQPV
jgi:hypothetical protein